MHWLDSWGSGCTGKVRYWVVEVGMQEWMGVAALETGTSCDFKIESSGPEIVDKFLLFSSLKVKRISR